MLRELFHIQYQLNRSIGFPGTFETREDLLKADQGSAVRNAIVAELGEAMQAAKPLWAWWRKPGDTLELNTDAVADELVDVMFFLLTYIDQMQNAAYEEARLTGRLPMPLIPEDEGERLEIVSATLDMMELSLYDDQGRTAPDVFVQQLRDDGTPNAEIITTMIRACINGITDPGLDAEAIHQLYMRVLTVWSGLDLTQEDLWLRYHDKAIVNLDRWRAAGIITVADDVYQTLYEDVNEQGSQPMPRAKLDTAKHDELREEASKAGRMIRAMDAASHAEVIHDEHGNPLLN